MSVIPIMASIVHCYVGCNTGSPDKQALHVLECDTETGAAKIVQSVKGVEGTTYFQFDKDGKYLYSVIGEKRDTKPASAAVRFPLDGWKLGAMERVTGLPCEAPCHVALSPDCRYFSFAAYVSATAGVLPLTGFEGWKKDGMTPPVSFDVLPDDAMGPNAKRQRKAFAHQTFYTPDGRLMGVVDLGCDRIRFYDPAEMRCEPAMTLKFDPGDGPRHAIWSKDGKALFVLCELGSCVCSFAFDGKAFVRVGKWSMLPDGYNRWEADGETLNTKAAAIKLTADGKVLMASNRGYDSIAFYEVGPRGKLTLKNIAKLRGKFPRDFELMPGEKFMVVGHKMSNEIQVYRFDRAACALEPVGEPIAAWRPLCFKFAH